MFHVKVRYLFHLKVSILPIHKYQLVCICTLVANRRRNKSSIFGRDMAEAFRDGEPMPEIVAFEESDSDSDRNMKRLILDMVAFDGSERPPIEEVRECLGKLDNQYCVMEITKHMYTTTISIIIY